MKKSLCLLFLFVSLPCWAETTIGSVSYWDSNAAKMKWSDAEYTCRLAPGEDAGFFTVGADAAPSARPGDERRPPRLG